MPSKTSSQSLYELLSETELLAYYSAFKTKLKIDNVDHLKYVAESDLADIGMSKPEQRRLLKGLQKRYPNSVLGKLKKKVFDKVHGSNSSLADCNDGTFLSSQRVEQHIIPSSRIILCQQLGAGEFGDVWQGVWSGNSSPPEKIQVAVKCIPPEKMAANPLNFVQEAAIMHRIEHENIVRLFGVVLEPKTIMLVTELAPLRSLLECLKQTSSKISFTILRLCDYAEQICSGMAYLEINRLIHRDLAARNILVFSVDRVKVSDFGLSRALGAGEDYYRGNFGVSLKLPIAWCAPECIKYLKFTSSSDVWSFGVTLWEMFTYGFQPFLGMTGRQILEMVDKPTSQRLEPPDDCPLEYYNLMLQTWEHEPGNRPKFADIHGVLPEIRPEQVRTVSDCVDGQLDHLQYKSGDLITVLSKRPREYPDGFYWKGILNNGRTGLFSPSNTVAYLSLDFSHFSKVASTNQAQNGNNLMTSSFSSASVSSGHSLTSSRSFGGVGASIRSSFNSRNNHQNKQQKISRKLISGPQNDFRHTGHVGLDGSSFGDVDFLPDKSHLPLQIVAPFQAVTDENSTCCFGGHSSQNSPMTTDADRRLQSTTSETAVLLPTTNRSSSAMSGGLDLDQPVLDNRRLRDDGGGQSLLDEVFDALKAWEKKETVDYSQGRRNFAMDTSEPSSPIDVADGSKLLADQNSSGRSVKTYSSKNVKQQAAVKPLSSSDAKMLDNLTSLAGKISDKAWTKDRERQEKFLRPDADEDSTASGREKWSPTSNIRSKLNKLKLRENSPLSDERRTFCENLPRSNPIRISPEAENAYKSLIEAKSSAPTMIPLDAEPEEDNPLRMLRNDGTALVRSFRAGSGRRQLDCGPPPPRKQPQSTAPPIPPKTFKTDRSSTLPPAMPGQQSTVTQGRDKSGPPPVPPKPKMTVRAETDNPKSLQQQQPQMNYAVLQTTPTCEPKSYDDDSCLPTMTFESVDKYQLLNFVLSPLRANEAQHMETTGAARI